MLVSIDRQPSVRKLIMFATSWFVGGAVVSAVASMGHHPTWALTIFLLATVPLLAGLLAGLRGLRAVYLFINYAAAPLAATVGVVALAIVYFLVLTPVGLALRLTGYDPLQSRNVDARLTESFWERVRGAEDSETAEPDLDASSIRRYFRQY